MRDDFFETPPLPPDAITWVVSGFDRQTLKPSITYQISSTTAAPLNLVTFTPKSTSTDSLHSTNGDKRINRNITAASITRGLIHPFDSTSNNHLSNSHEKLEHLKTNPKSSPVMGGINGNGGVIGDINDTNLHRAPYYTFYSSRNTLQKYDFVLNTSRDVLEYLQTWLGVLYPLDKLGKF